MSGGRKHELNGLDDPAFNPLDPACVSDPACWLPMEVRAELQKTFLERMSMLKHAPKFRDGEGACGVMYVDSDDKEQK